MNPFIHLIKHTMTKTKKLEYKDYIPYLQECQRRVESTRKDVILCDQVLKEARERHYKTYHECDRCRGKPKCLSMGLKSAITGKKRAIAEYNRARAEADYMERRSRCVQSLGVINKGLVQIVQSIGNESMLGEMIKEIEIFDEKISKLDKDIKDFADDQKRTKEIIEYLFSQSP